MNNYSLIKNALLSNKITNLKPKGYIIDTVLNVSFNSEKEIKSISAAKYNL